MPSDDVFVQGPDGELQQFPKGTSDNFIHMAMLSRYGNGQTAKPPVPQELTNQNPNQTNSLQELSSGRPDTPGQQKQGYSKATELLPALGSTIGPEGTAIGMLAHQALSPEGPSGGSAIKDALFNEAIPYVGSKIAGPVLGLGGKIAKKMVDAQQNPSVKNWIGEQLDKIAPQSRVSDILDSASTNAKQFPSSLAKSDVASSLRELPTSGTGTSDASYAPIANKVLSDVQQVRNFKVAGGDADALGAQRLVNKSFNNAKNTFDPDKLLNELGGDNKEVYDEALSPTTKENLLNLTSKIKELGSSGEKPTGFMRYTGHRIMFDIAGGIAGGMLGHNIESTALGAGSIILGQKALVALSKSKMLGDVAVKALETSPSSELAPLYQRTLMYGLRGIPIVFKTKDGEEENATIGPNGQVQAIPPNSK